MPEIPHFPTHLPGELWGVTAYFNPHAIPLQLQNLHEFSDHVRSQGLKLLIVELAFGAASFSAPAELGDQILRCRTDTVLWQKERLLNLGIAQLPASCDKVAWLDGDILFENAAWVAETARLLAAYVVVQPFTTACWLPRAARSMAPAAPRGLGEGKCLPGIVAGLADVASLDGRRQALANYSLSGHTGFAWAARRTLLTTHALYDRGIVGGADMPIAHALLGDEDFWQGNNIYCRHLTASALADIAQWSRAIHQDVAGSVAYTPGRVLHLWHGDMTTRSYVARQRILRDNAYDPRLDIAIDADGCWRWNSDKPELHRQVRDYFTARGRAVHEELDHAAAAR
jgi:hypothetical protein